LPGKPPNQSDVTLYYTATASLNPTTNRTYGGQKLDWQTYLAWTGFGHVREIVSLDGILGEDILDRGSRLDAASRVWEEEFSPALCFYDLDYLLNELEGIDPTTYNLLAILREPGHSVNEVPVPGFAFVGYEILDQWAGNSLLTNCGPSPQAFVPEDLNESGLLQDYEQARQVQAKLNQYYPDNPHAKDCVIWAIWRMSRPNDLSRPD